MKGGTAAQVAVAGEPVSIGRQIFWTIAFRKTESLL
jgi:hypothetical protein